MRIILKHSGEIRRNKEDGSRFAFGAFKEEKNVYSRPDVLLSESNPKEYGATEVANHTGYPSTPWKSITTFQSRKFASIQGVTVHEGP